MSERTVWFPSSINPTRPGVYERQYFWGVSYAHFDGEEWGVSEDTPESAYVWRSVASAETCPWRGLTKRGWTEYTA